MALAPLIGGSMPLWLGSALRLLVGSPLRALTTGGVVGSLLPDIPGIPGLGDLFGGGGGKPRRRRRRRALTASDRADIAFIAGMLGQPAGRQFAMLIGSRTAS